MSDLVGWLATGLFLSSYLLPPSYLLRMQFCGAFTWAMYGVLLHSYPLIVANSLMLIAVAYAWRRRRRVPAPFPPVT